jgi:hypothetical protein
MEISRPSTRSTDSAARSTLPVQQQSS